MTDDELRSVLEEHTKWARGEGGKRANLSGANLSGAYLSGANLSGANLYGANLYGANLDDTCLSIDLYEQQRGFCRQSPMLHTGGRIVYRTLVSQHVGKQEYKPGHTYTAPILSFDCNTDCHPGIYAGTLQQIREQYPDAALVRCYVRDGDWVINRKGIRCKKLRVLGHVVPAP